MLGYALPILFTLFVWWFSTGAILYLDGLPQRTFRWSLLAATALLMWALSVMADSASQTSVVAVYKSFTCGIVCWGWVEMSFLMGFITGPRRSACPSGAQGWRRAGFAFETILYHELALILIGLTIAYLTWDAPNRIGLYAFAVLWLLRQSAKLNVFFGAPNLSEEFLPEHLRYLQSYFTRKRMNLLFPFSVTAATVAAALLWRDAVSTNVVGAFQLTQSTFLATLVSLGLLEHWFLVVPIPANMLWKWGMGSRREATPTAAHGLSRTEMAAASTRAVIVR